MPWIDDIRESVSEFGRNVVRAGRVVGAGLFESASGAITRAISGEVDTPEAGPVYGVDPYGVTRTDALYYDSTGRLVQREIVGQVPGTNLPVYRIGEFDARNSPGVPANAGSPETLSTFIRSPIGLAAIGAAAIGGFLLLRK